MTKTLTVFVRTVQASSPIKPGYSGDLKIGLSAFF